MFIDVFEIKLVKVKFNILIFEFLWVIRVFNYLVREIYIG